MDYFIQISYLSSLTVFFSGQKTDRICGFGVMAKKITICCPFSETFWSGKVRDYLPLIYYKSLFNMNFQFVRFVVTTSFSSRWWPHEKQWRHENTMWYISSVFPPISIFWCATTILKSDFVFVECLHCYERILEFSQFSPRKHFK